MSAEVIPMRQEVDVVADGGAVDIPASMIVAIARAAVDAYKEGLRARDAAYQRAYYAVNRERILEQQRLRREAKRLHLL